jgi:hypothetical protein
MGRKIDEKNPVPGTRKGDAGATIKMYPEKQCPKKPLPGQKLCKICNEKAEESKANPATVPTGYFGRLDEPLFHMARVIGCGYFFEKYPNGLAEDPTTAPVAKETSAVATGAAEPKVAEPKVAEPKVAEPKVAEPKVTKPKVAKAKVTDESKPTESKADEVAEPKVAAEHKVAAEPKAKKPRAKKLTTTNTTVAASGEAPVKPEWVTFLYEGRVHIRNEKDGRTYEADTSKKDREEMVKKDSYKGRWRDGALDIYAPEEDDTE